ncbi:signal recognition particle receptor protein [Buttiauxella brennerae ATCC 51605]|uniref:Signal recognition particle receptor FtsY n=1 Tax=Buttiauxella brennerae ATCC 51605 TaxID=1354251 RepID=A0A1B7IHT8_9ENTR|nr:signal recognition particle-docking protein FtsY [Buttiauxella brennerae]OAT29010.1 signal recognition particle receptor protein [Buttiauxella brennerae ATCC 51605]
MAKEKKRGFFSWLGFGQKEQASEQEPEQKVAEEQPVAEEIVEQIVESEQPQAADETAQPEEIKPEAQTEIQPEVLPEAEPVVLEKHEEPEAFAEEIVEVTEKLVESEVAAVEPEIIPEPEPEVTAQAVVEHEELPVPEEIVASEVAQVESLEEWQPEQEPVVSETVVEAVVEAEPVIETEELVEPEEVAVAPVEAIVVENVIVEDIAVEEVVVEEAPVEDVVEEVPVAAAIVEDVPVDVEPEETQAEEIQQEQERPTKEGFFARLKRSLIKTKQNLGSGFISLFRGKKIDDDLFEELEEQLLIADVGVETTRKIITNLTEGASRKELRDAEALYGLLKEEMGEILAKVDEPLKVEGKTPFVILMVGVNGVGKTTTIGKLARQFQQEGKSVMLAAGDTFRAAAVEQLQVWGDRNNIPVIAQHTGADSASVIFDAIQAAKARNVDVLLADTAGRLQNKAHLMEELKKIVRVMKKLDGDAPHEVMLTLDASTGQNAISQAKLFHEAVGLTGITLTKLDGTAKGGVIFSVADQFGIPIRYIGVGERIEDLRPFNAGDFIEALFARED